MSAGKRPAAGAMANTMATKRVKKEIADLTRENLGGITLTPNDSNIFIWRATIPGPAGSPYEGGEFDVDIRIPDNYPFSPPHLQFQTKVYHCNIASTGAICLDILKHAWSPAMSLFKVILSLSSLLTDPNPADPLVPQIASEYKRDRKKHDATAREWTKNFATPKTPKPAPTAPEPKAAASTSSTAPTARRVRRPMTDIAPPAPVAGTRRSNPFSNGRSSENPHNRSTSRPETRLEDSDIEAELGSSDVEFVSGSSTAGGSRGRNAVRANGNGNVSGVSPAGSADDRDIRAAKRSRLGASRSGVGASGTADDVIVVDE